MALKELRRILVREQAKLPPFVPDPPTTQEVKSNPKAYKAWLEKYHKSIVIPLQQQFREIQQALLGLSSQFGDVNEVFNTQEASAITPEVVTETVDTAISDLNLGTASTRPIEDFAAVIHTHGNITNGGAIGTAANKPIITSTNGVLQAGAFGSVTNTFCEGNDLRLSDARVPLPHVHGNISDDGAVGTTANLPLITGASGVIQASSFGSTSNTFCQGNDPRLSDARVPLPHTHGNISDGGAVGTTANLPLITGASGVIQASSFGSTSNTFCEGNDPRLSDARVPLSHTHGNISNAGAVGTTANLPLITGTDGVIQASSFGSTSNTFCEGNDPRLSDARVPLSHTHGNISNGGAVGTTANLPLITGADGVIQASSFGSTTNTFCQGNDPRLSDARVPLAHASTHLFGGTDQLFNQNLNTTDSVTFEGVSTKKVAFNLTSTIDPTKGEATWDNEEETLLLGLAHNLDLPLGQKTVYHVENSTASAIGKGILIMFAGTVGASGKLRVKPWDGSLPQKTIMGIAASNIDAGVGEQGYVAHFGKVRGVNASGSPYGETWVNGDILFARPLGGLTKYPAYMEVVKAGTTGVNDQYTLRGMSGGKPYYNRNGQATSTTLNAIVWSSTKWIITDNAGATMYESTENVITPDLVVTWVVGSGALPVPVLDDRPEQSTIVAAVVSNHSVVGTLLVRLSQGIDLDRIGAAPTYHADSHASSGYDPITPAMIGAAVIGTDAGEAQDAHRGVLTKGGFEQLEINGSEIQGFFDFRTTQSSDPCIRLQVYDEDEETVIGEAILGVRSGDAFLQSGAGSGDIFRIEQAGGGLANLQVLGLRNDDEEYEFPERSGTLVVSDETTATGASAVTNIVAISETDYDDIVTPDANTLYIVTDGKIYLGSTLIVS